MLTLLEKIIFAVAVLASLFAASRATLRIVKIISRGYGRPDWDLALKRLVSVLPKVAALLPTFRIRLIPSLFHALVAWGFLFFLLVNAGDVLEGYFPSFHFMGQGTIGNVYRLIADVFTVAVLVGIAVMIVRRFLFKPDTLTTRSDVLLHPKARFGILRDSAIVGSFIFLHVGARFFGQSFFIARFGFDRWRPFASMVSQLWAGASDLALVVGEHITFWLALGTILAFIPYFLYSKHIHLFFAPLNFLLKPNRRSIGELSKLDFDDESAEQFGVSRMEELGWEQLMDAYACIMCYRCQQVCPAYSTGKVLSPAALEINKRYFLNYQGARIANGEESTQTLIEFAIPEEAVWACTACGACIDICPVNNEPMRDILDIRRAQVLMENNFPEQLQVAFRGMERTANPWNISPTERMKWAEGLDVPTIEERPKPDILWWVGCAPATDARAQKTAQAFAKILNTAGVNYAVLGQSEQCTGDSARRAGNEFLFNELASANVELLNQAAPRRIVTTCPHCLHTLKNEYPAFGGDYQVIHHTQLIDELFDQGLLKVKNLSSKAPLFSIPGYTQSPEEKQSEISNLLSKITFHDPCYLGRHNKIVADPRRVLKHLGVQLIEMPNHGYRSFCCGAGGAQMWKEEEEGEERVNLHRFREAQKTGASTLAVGCPFCMVMLTDAQKAAGSEMQVLDIVEIVAAQLETG
jgi:Fe-S oxidoreductase